MNMYFSVSVYSHPGSLNTIREVCSRCPLVMTKDNMEYIAALKTYKDKSELIETLHFLHYCEWHINPVYGRAIKREQRALLRCP